MWLGVRERILTIRLMEKLENCPAYAKQIGISVSPSAGAAPAKPAGRAS